jgi:putative colanic acid biosynthesis acetyltransferase WcaF
MSKISKGAEAAEGRSPWSARTRVRILIWEWCWNLFCRWTPKPFNSWRLLWLRAFGAEIIGSPFVHQRARIQIPWNVTLHDQSCLGDRANLYSLGRIEVGRRAVIAQEAYICCGTHDFEKKDLPLVTGTVHIGDEVFIGARAFVLAGVRIGERAIVGACSVVTRDVAADTINAGNPSRVIRDRRHILTNHEMGDTCST